MASEEICQKIKNNPYGQSVSVVFSTAHIPVSDQMILSRVAAESDNGQQHISVGDAWIFAMDYSFILHLNKGKACLDMMQAEGVSGALIELLDALITGTGSHYLFLDKNVKPVDFLPVF